MDDNLRPHAEARAAMYLWSHEYAYEQKGGSMDFWDSLSDERKRLCISLVNDILGAERNNGRAQAAIATLRENYASRQYHSRFEDGELSACEKIEKAMEGRE